MNESDLKAALAFATTVIAIVGVGAISALMAYEYSNALRGTL